MGIYKPETPTYCLGDYVWYDNNHNGIQDGGETGVQGVDVTLYKDGTATGDTDTTDADGKYLFCGLGEGNYSVAFDKSSLPTDYAITTQDVGSDDARDSDANPTDGKTAKVEIKDSNNTTLDMGIRQVFYRLGDLFWIDANNDGVYDSGEKTIPDARIELLNKDGSVVAATMTDKNGRYHFDVPAGEYKVRFHIPQTMIEDGYTFDNIQKEGDDTNKVNGEGIVEVSAEVGSGIATQNLTLDAAIHCPCADVTSDNVDAMKTMANLLMSLFSLWIGILMLRKEERWFG